MSRTAVILVALLGGVSIYLCAGEIAVERRKAETIRKAEQLFGQRYTPASGKPLRLYDKQTGTGPPDAVIYWHGSSYVIEIIFAPDGAVARLALLPEALMHSDYWGNVPSTVELARAEMQWLIASANVLQPLGNAREVREAPDTCFQSGPNLYCHDSYELASVSHYHLVRGDKNLATGAAMRDIVVSYRRSIVGIVEDVGVEETQRRVKLGGQWYQANRPGVETFEKAQIGSTLRFITYGCTANEKTCIALREQSSSAATDE